MKTLLITQLFQIINKTSRKHSHKKQKVYYVIDMLWLSNLKLTGSICDNLFHLSDLYNCLRSLYTVAIRTENEKEKRKSSLQAAFSLF